MMHKLFVMLIGVVAGATVAAAADQNPSIPAQSVHAKLWPSTAHAAVVRYAIVLVGGLAILVVRSVF